MRLSLLTALIVQVLFLVTFGVVSCVRAQDIVLDNGVIRVGVDPAHGGSIEMFSRTGVREANIINSFDMGREVQLSFYSGPDVYNPDGKCHRLFMDKDWPWNPIGAGDVMGNHGEVLDQKATATTARVVTRPLQWACNNVPCECTFDQELSLDTPKGLGVRVVATLHNNRSDTTVYPARPQELPAVYANGAYYRLVTYENGKLKEYETGFDPTTQWVPGMFSVDEGWAALVDESGYGLGVVNHGVGKMIGGFSGVKGGGGPTDPQTGYVSPIADVALPAVGDYSFTFHLVQGTIDEIRWYAHATAAQDQKYSLRSKAII